jgi:hypothetical protein
MIGRRVSAAIQGMQVQPPDNLNASPIEPRIALIVVLQRDAEKYTGYTSVKT